MAHDWLRGLFLRWNRLSPRRPRPARITVEALEDRVTPDTKPLSSGLIPPFMPNGEPRFQPGPMLTASPTEVTLQFRGADPVSVIAQYVMNEEGNANFIDLSRTAVLFSDPANGTSLVRVGLRNNPNVWHAVGWLESVPGVNWANPNYIVNADARDFVPNDPRYKDQYHHALMQMEKAWDITTGSSEIIVAITDDGLSTNHVDLVNNLWVNPGEIPGNGVDDDGNGFIDDINGWDFASNDRDPNPVGSSTHGTHVGGIVAATTNNSIGVAGVAGGNGKSGSGVRLMGLRWDGPWTAQGVANSFAYAANNGAKIVNSSYNFDFFTDNNGNVDPTVDAGFAYSYGQGVLHFLSAGNNSQLQPPRRVLTYPLFVASTDQNDARSGFSNYGKFVDISAPGSGIWSTTTSANGTTSSYEAFDGTSMATPNAAAVAALIWSQFPDYTREQVVSKLLATSDPIDANNPSFAGLLGAGRVNAYKSLTTALTPPKLGVMVGVPTEGAKLQTAGSWEIFTPSIFNPATVTAANIELRGAGPDGKFNTSDDQIIPIIINGGTPYRIGTDSFKFQIPALGTDSYRFTIKAGGLADPFGQALDGNGDGVGGDSFVRNFSISVPVAGMVFEDVNGNGLAEFGEPGLPNVQVFIDTNKNGTFDAGEPSVITDFAGRYTIPGTPAGNYRVSRVPPTGFLASGAKFNDITIPVGGSVSNVNFGLVRQDSVYGAVFQDFNKNAKRDSGEFGAEGFQVFIDANQNGVYDAPTQGKDSSFTENTPVSIPDLGSASSSMVISGLSGIVLDVNIRVNITHTYVGDLAANLVGPDGTRVLLFNGVGGAGANFVGTLFDDQAKRSITTGTAPFTGQWRPMGQLSTLNNRSANGKWTLEISDNLFFDVGTLDSWTLFIRTSVGDQLFTTDGTGNFRFDVPPGTMDVAINKQAGWLPVNPPNWSPYTVSVTSGSVALGNVFALFPDFTAPTISKIFTVDRNPTNASLVTYEVQFSEFVNGVTKDIFSTIQGPGISGSFVTGVTGSGAKYRVQVNTGTGSGTLALAVSSAGGVQDPAQNPLEGPFPFNGPSFTIDRVAPTSKIVSPISGTITKQGTWPGTITGTADDVGTGVQFVQVSMQQPGTGFFWNGFAFASASEFYLDASGTNNWSFTIPEAAFGSIEGPYVLRVYATDTAGNAQSGSTSASYTYDIGAPALAITPNSKIINANPPQFLFTFSEPVTAFDKNQISLTGGTISNISGSGTQYTVTVDPAGSGLISISAGQGTAYDIAGNPSKAASASITFDATAPTVSIGNLPTGSAFSIISWPGMLTGISGDDLTGVTQVGVAIRRASTGLFWNGTDFTSVDPVYLPASGTTSWSFAHPGSKFPADDNYQFLVRATDAAGNTATQTSTVAYDNTAPVPTIQAPTASALLNAAAWDQGGRIRGIATDNVAGVSKTSVAIIQLATGLAWDGTGFNSPTPVFQPSAGLPTDWTFPALSSDKLADGNYRVIARTTDAAGNVAEQQVQFEFDNTSPVPNVSFPASGFGYNATGWGAGQIAGTVSDRGDTAVTRIALRQFSDGKYWNGSWFGSTDPVYLPTSGQPDNWQFTFSSFGFPGEGKYEVTVLSTDQAGNTASAASQFSFDRSPPTSTVNMPGGKRVFNLENWPGTVTGTASDTLSNIANVRVSVRQVAGGRFWDGSGFNAATEVLFPVNGTTAWTFPFGITDFPADGNYIFSSYATDDATNVQPFASTATFTVDRTPPTATLSTSGGTMSNVAQIGYVITFSEPVSGFDASDLILSNATLTSLNVVSPTRVNVIVTAIADGEVSVGVRNAAAEDVAGNRTAVVPPISVGFDRTAPTVTLSALPGQVKLGTELPVAITFSEPVVGFDGSSLIVANGQVRAISGSGTQFVAQIVPLGPGPVAVSVPAAAFTDIAGNANAAVPAVTRVATQERFAIGVGPVLRSFLTPEEMRLQLNPFGADYIGEVRVASADFTGDGIPDIVAATGPGFVTEVRIFDGATGQLLLQMQPFEDSFKGGVNISAGDLSGDGIPEFVISPDEGGGPRVRIFDGNGFGQLADFFGIDDPAFRGGARTAIGDFNGDGSGELAVAAGFGGGPRVAIYDGPAVISGSLIRVVGDFFAYEESLRNGVYIAAGDLNGDGKAELVIGGGPGGGPRVSVLNGSDLADNRVNRIADYFAGSTDNRGGARVAVKQLDTNGDGEILVGSGASDGNRIAIYPGARLLSGDTSASFEQDLMTEFPGGVYVG